MSKIANKLKSIFESWEKAGDNTDYGKKEDLPKIDYWRRVGGQNVGFVGKDGEGVPVTGFSGNRAVLMGRDPEVAYAPSELASKYLKKAIANAGSDVAGKKAFELTGSEVIDIQMTGLASAMEIHAASDQDYKKARKNGAKKFEAVLREALKKVGMSWEKFDAISDTTRKEWSGGQVLDNDSVLLLPVFDEIRKAIIEENQKKFESIDPKWSSVAARLSSGCQISFNQENQAKLVELLGTKNTESGEEERKKYYDKNKDKLLDGIKKTMMLYANLLPERRELSIIVKNEYRFRACYYARTDQIALGSDDVRSMMGDDVGMMGDDVDRAFSHEITHWCDARVNGLNAAAIRFLGNRAGYKKTDTDLGFAFGDQAKLIGTHMVDGKKVADEIAFEDDFTEVYVGKVYASRNYVTGSWKNDDYEILGTEVNSMSAQQFSSAKAMVALYRDDKDLFEHGYALMTGQFNDIQKDSGKA